MNSLSNGHSTRHIFITGGVVSSLGKGITAASLGLLLKQRGYRVRIQKLDPYLNVDPGTMSPYQHGEVFVTEDGAETDLDLGHYERFADLDCDRQCNFTTGGIYSRVISRERRGDYLGGTVQVIPHVTDEIKRVISDLDSGDLDIAITEIGGTAGDIESLPFLEAIRQYRQERPAGEVLFLHLTLVPYIKAAAELKTKPSQQSVGILREIGIIPDILVCRSERPLEEEHFKKLALFCNVRRELVFEELDVADSIYEVPLEMAKQKLDEHILRLLGLPSGILEMAAWQNMVDRLFRLEKEKENEVVIALVGKYIGLRDAYKSIYEALCHGTLANSLRLRIKTLEAEELTDERVYEELSEVHGILIPGGFGDRGIEGKIRAIRFARENKLPLFGICLGMQCAVIEFARDVCGIAEADSSEFRPDIAAPVIDLMENQKKLDNLGGTMRLGAYGCDLLAGSKARAAYGQTQIKERHRHRYELNNEFKDTLEENGMLITGMMSGGKLAEIVEIPEHPWFVTCQFHPEFKSRPLKPHPLFREFIAAAGRSGAARLRGKENRTD